MKKLTTFLMIVIAFVTVAQAQNFPIDSWIDAADTGWYDENQSEFTITTAEELAGMAELVQSGTTFEDQTITLDADIDLDAKLWTPIGEDVDHPFSGTFNGNNHTISNLWINLPEEDFVGLFGRCSGASFTDLIVKTAHVTAKDTSAVLVGSLSTNSTMDNCHVIDISMTATSYNIGGLIGELVGDSNISNCSASGEVVGENQVGLLLGTAFDKTNISESYSEGTVSGGYLIGGLVGYCTFAFQPDRNNTVDNCYSRASVEGEQGRVGGIYGGSDGNLRLKNSYATGTVEAPELAGAVIGAWGSEDIVVENCYFDTETSQLSDGIGGYVNNASGDDNTEGKSTAEMKNQDFVDVLNAGSDDAPWMIDSDINDGYPAFESTLSVPDYQMNKESLVVYPTNFDQKVTISAEQSRLTAYRIYNYAGTLVEQGNLKGQQTSIYPSNLAAGIYLLQIETAQGTLTKRIIKK